MGWIFGAALLLGALLGGGVYLVRDWPDRPGPLTEAQDIVVPRGSARDIGVALVQAGVLDRLLPFRAAAWITRAKGPLRAAEFHFPARASLREVLGILRTARPVEHRITFIEGATAYQILDILNHAQGATGTVASLVEGSVLPETYSYAYGMARSAILSRATEAMDRALAAAWANRAPDLPLKTPLEALALASIVERETSKPDERPHIAAVYLNRLRLGMRLQADPTVVYAVSGGVGVLDHRLTRAELDQDDKFNTYRNAGLPPGPICSPGAASLVAVTHPADSPDLFFVADGTGGHAFARTREAHERNVARWRALGN